MPTNLPPVPPFLSGPGLALPGDPNLIHEIGPGPSQGIVPTANTDRFTWLDMIIEPETFPEGSPTTSFLTPQKGAVHRLVASVSSAPKTTWRYPSGAPRSVLLMGETTIRTPLGPMVPNWRFEEARSKHAPSITLYESGALRGLRLAKPSLVKSPIGPLPAERLTFYESGALKRLFPVDGGLSGFWSLADEKKLNRKIRLGLKFGTYDLFVSGLAFYETGQLRSVTVWPGENPLLPLPISGAMAPVGAGFSLFPNGDLQSLEPRRPFKADTPLGPMEAFDPEATGITADKNSLAFGLDGKVTALKSLVIVEADTPSGPIKIFPNVKPSPLSDGQKLHLPLSFAFAGDTVTVSRGFPNGQAITLPLSSPIRLRPYYDHALTGIALPRPPLKPSRPI